MKLLSKAGYIRIVALDMHKNNVEETLQNPNFHNMFIVKLLPRFFRYRVLMRLTPVFRRFKRFNSMVTGNFSLAIWDTSFFYCSYLQIKHLKTYPRTYFGGHFGNMSVYTDFLTIWVLLRKRLPQKSKCSWWRSNDYPLFRQLKYYLIAWYISISHQQFGTLSFGNFFGHIWTYKTYFG